MTDWIGSCSSCLWEQEFDTEEEAKEATLQHGHGMATQYKPKSRANTEKSAQSGNE